MITWVCRWSLAYDPYTINLYRSEHGGRRASGRPPAMGSGWPGGQKKITNFLAEVYKLVKSRPVLSARCFDFAESLPLRLRQLPARLAGMGRTRGGG